MRYAHKFPMTNYVSGFLCEAIYTYLTEKLRVTKQGISEIDKASIFGSRFNFIQEFIVENIIYLQLASTSSTVPVGHKIINTILISAKSIKLSFKNINRSRQKLFHAD